MKRRLTLLTGLIVIILFVCHTTAIDIPTDGLVAYYSFDDGTATDNSGNGFDGTINGASVTEGISGNALHFDGNDVVTLPFLFSDNMEARQVTLVAFVNLSGLIMSETFINTGDPEIGMGLSNDGHVGSGVKMSDNNWHVVTGSSDVPLNEWIMVTTTLNKDTTLYQVYLDGVLDGTSTVPDINYWHWGLIPAIGAHMYAGGENYLNGDIDEVMIYNRTLTVEEISSIHTLYNGPPCSIVGTWERTDGDDIYTFYEDGTGQTTFWGQTHTCTWVKQYDEYRFTWDFGPNPSSPYFIDTVTISNDCNSFSGTNNYGDTVTTIRIANQPPLAADDAYTIDQDAILSIPYPGVLQNDSDPDGEPLTASVVSDPINGDLSFNSDGSFTYTPLPEWYGNVTFTYKANDGLADSDTAAVWINVIKIPEPTEYVINATNSTGGTISPSGDTTVSSGGSQVFNLLAERKYKPASITIDNITIDLQNLVVTFNNVLSDHTIHAEFASPGKPPK